MFKQNQKPSASLVETTSTQAFSPVMPGHGPQGTNTPLTSQHMAPARQPKQHSLVQTVILIIVTLIAVLFIILFIQKFAEVQTLSSDVDGQIDAAVAMAVAENTSKMEEEFAEREKYPYRSFLGPADYGSLGFEYPQTWSVYIGKDALNGGDFEAYLNPLEVEPVSNTTINALRVRIRDASFDSVVVTYDNLVKSGKVSFSTRSVGGIVANIYSGDLPNNIRGVIAIFKLRDKTVLLQTDAELFVDVFYQILDSVTVIQ